MRKAFANTLIELSRKDERIVLLTGDLGFGVFDDFRREFPNRFINVGIAEQAMVDIAAGLALEGCRPIVYSIASFMTGRCWEQIKVSLAYHGLPVVVAGAGGGYSYSTAGTTHHAAEDLGLMSLIPGMTVTAPGCPSELASLLPQLIDLPGPSYMRIGKYGEPEYDEIYIAMLGKARCLRIAWSNNPIAILTTGDRPLAALEAACEVGASVYQFHTVKPLDTTRLAMIDRCYNTIVVVEEHSRNGGLYAAIKNVNMSAKVVRCGPSDSFLEFPVDRQTFEKQAHLDVASIVETCRRAVECR